MALSDLTHYQKIVGGIGICIGMGKKLDSKLHS